MHNAAFAADGLGPDGAEYVYVAMDVLPELLPEAVGGLKALGFAGFNVTMPHKAAILPLLDGIDEAARLSGAVNTVASRDGGLFGYNTDGSGFVEACREAGVFLAGRRVAILGAGGAASAIAVAVLNEGAARLDIFNRTVSRARSLCEKLGEAAYGISIEAHSLEDASEVVEGAEVIVNATYLGMKEGDPLPVSAGTLDAGKVVCDAVYLAGRETALIKIAREAGARTVSGGRMLLYQGVEAQRIWTGREPNVEAMSYAFD